MAARLVPLRADRFGLWIKPEVVRETVNGPLSGEELTGDLELVGVAVANGGEPPRSPV